MTTVDIPQARSLVEADWLLTSTGSELHFADLSTEDLVVLVDWSQVDEEVTLACGQSATGVHIPGYGDRLLATRCVGCCEVLGYPVGVGSPKNAPECAEVLATRLAAHKSPAAEPAPDAHTLHAHWVGVRDRHRPMVSRPDLCRECLEPSPCDARREADEALACFELRSVAARKDTR